MRPLIDVGPLLPLLVEVPLLILQQYISTIRNRRITGAVVELNYEPPAYRPSYRRWFECDVRFQCARNALVTPGCGATLPTSATKNSRGSTLQKCVIQNREAPRYIVNRLRWQTVRRVRPDRSEFPYADARRYGRHPSYVVSLIRRLRGMDRASTEQDRLADASELLDAGLRASEIAEVLRFSDSTNFGKAFKRWFGESPSRYTARRDEPNAAGLRR